MIFRKLKTKILAVYFIISILTALTVLISVYQFFALEKKLDYINEDIAVSIKITTEVQSTILSLGIMAHTTKFLISIIGAVIILLGLTLGFLLSRQVLTPIEKLVQYTERVSKGELSKINEFQSNDEFRSIYRAINIIVSNFKKIVTDISQNSKELSKASENIVNIAGSLSNNSEQMLFKSEKVANASYKMTTNINKIASSITEMSNNIKNVSISSSEISGEVQSITQSIESMSNSMSAIDTAATKGMKIAVNARSSTNNASRIINNLGASADEIGEVINMIKRIADKTNLLALNAAIEAASAGEYGKGFAVVSNAIQKFADQSNNAAENIAVSISGVQEDILKAINAIAEVSVITEEMLTSTEIITNDVEIQLFISDTILSNISNANDRTNDVAASIGDLSQSVNSISDKAENVASGANHVTDNIKGVSIAAREFADKVQQVKTSANQLSNISEDLMMLINIFNISDINYKNSPENSEKL
ncbi:Methyl-accepting chemotaxis protein [Candidatus Magnetomorum sp. HK-1]|nr:Methyl-accepting chemotaxis protein [Candidatus Magnetomorum sp. HK-1]